MDVKEFKKLPIMGILRGAPKESIQPLTETIISSGLKTIEIAMNTPDAASQIKNMSKAANKKLTIGAGTVLTMDILKSALDAGASFIVMPTLVADVVNYCVKNKIPVFPGAFTPQEIYNAWRSGATMVKVFPAKFFGPDYIKEIKGPFNEIELLACGGVNPQNIASFFKAGASAVAFGGSVFDTNLISKGKFDGIADSIKALISAYIA